MHNRCRLHYHNKAATRLNGTLLAQKGSEDGLQQQSKRQRLSFRSLSQEKDSAKVWMKSDFSSRFISKILWNIAAPFFTETFTFLQ